VLAIRALARTGDTVVDLGAGIGLTSIVSRNAVGSSGRVIAFEPVDTTCEELRQTVELNDSDVEIFNEGVSADGGELAIYQGDEFQESSVHIPTNTKRTSKSRRIDEIISQFKPDLLILDIEGSESLLLESSRISSVRSLIVELHPRIIGPETVRKIIEYLFQRGFDINLDVTAFGTVAFTSRTNDTAEV
jgi:FkbM family methyltransferase